MGTDIDGLLQMVQLISLPPAVPNLNIRVHQPGERRARIAKGVTSSIGAGPRTRTGRYLALLEMKLVMVGPFRHRKRRRLW
jgi:hypothetical protein